MKKYLLLLSLLLFHFCEAQDFTFSQFFEQPLLRNPALAGVFKGDIRVSMAYRDQWGSISVPFRTTSLSVEHKIPLGEHDDVLTIGTQMTIKKNTVFTGNQFSQITRSGKRHLSLFSIHGWAGIQSI
jgi:hypothetical protein